MIFGDAWNTIGIQIEYVHTFGDNDDAISGMCNFVLDGVIYPGDRSDYNLWNCIEGMRDSVLGFIEQNQPELGNTPIKKLDFSTGEPLGSVCLDTGEMGDRGFVCWFGFNKNKERFIYTLDENNIKSYKQLVLPRGTLEELVRNLPTDEQVKAQSNYRFYEGTDPEIPDVSIEPRNSAEIAKNSIILEYNPKYVYAADDNGDIHRFLNTKSGIYYWSGCTTDKNNPLRLSKKVKIWLKNRMGWEIK